MRLVGAGESRKRSAFVVVSMVALVVGLLGPRAIADHPTDYSISFVASIYDPVAQTTTFTWVLNGPDEGVSHVVIDTCLGDNALSSGGSLGGGEYTASDPTTGVSGYKWEGGNDVPVGSTFTLTFAGNLADTGTAEWTNKKGNHKDDPSAEQESGTTAGPSCATTTPTPTPTPTVTPAGDPTPTPTETVGGSGTPDAPPVDTPPVVTPPVDTPPVVVPPGFPPTPPVIEPPVITPPPVVGGRTDTVEPKDRVLGTRFDAAQPGGPEVQAAPGTLPVTGFPLSLTILTSVGLVGLGLSLVRLSRKRGRHSV